MEKWLFKISIAKYKKSRAIKDKIKIAAGEKVRRAILKGELIPQACEICSNLESIEAHHWDYSKPLEVQWLCKEHHIIADRQRRAIEVNFTGRKVLTVFESSLLFIKRVRYLVMTLNKKISD